MPEPSEDLHSKRSRLIRSFAAYDSDTFDMVDPELGDATHLVSTRKGLYAVHETGWKQIAFGFFFGMTIFGADIFLFEAGDQPKSTLARGRIVRLMRQGSRIESAQVLAKGLDNGCHQIDLIEERLHVVDTYRQVILRFDAGGGKYETLTPLPTAPGGRWAATDLNYAHVNSLLAVGDRILLLLHNTSEHTGRPSEVAVYDHSWQPLARWKLNGHSCHGLATLEDGTLLTCDTMSGDLIGSGDLRVHISPYITRGLAVGADSIVVGASRLAKREDRMTTSGTVTFLDRDYKVRAVLELPGAPTEIRRLDGLDSGLSNYLERVPWGNQLKEGTAIG